MVHPAYEGDDVDTTHTRASIYTFSHATSIHKYLYHVLVCVIFARSDKDQ
jgi:hypothetical protein